ncbi:HAD family phosphatase [Streptomyces sp. SL13]|uniref:HAD family phosphatase n=1 Tax=Streptantibioticus silvisoli TaxID=2705255 RepID=A0AA90KFJ0_9ACTN|nr:HAD family phosphatase [Streptantibioticus silvisoli]MDI5966234.1 HAD family phosphatase [Streptantibioticus silvisoli]MDI5968984.1 HAD family phosphatase [Streptantibioticus silvisoli]
MTVHTITDWTPSVVVFDCDGTLMDTERHWQAARDTVLLGYGVVPDPEFAELSKGVHYTDCGRMMAQFAGRPESTQAMTVQLLDAFRKLVAENPVPTPGAERMVAGVARFAPLAVASNCPLDVVESCLEAVGLLRYFERIVVPGDGVRPKPDPDPYLTAVRALGGEPRDALAVEDSVCGLRSAAAAGLRVLGVGPRPADEATELADWWVPSLAEPGLTAWVAGRIPRQPVA